MNLVYHEIVFFNFHSRHIRKLITLSFPLAWEGLLIYMPFLTINLKLFCTYIIVQTALLQALRLIVKVNFQTPLVLLDLSTCSDWVINKNAWQRESQRKEKAEEGLQ